MVRDFEERVARIVIGLSEEQLRIVALVGLNELRRRHARKIDMLETELGLSRYQNACLKEALRKYGILDPFSRQAHDEHISAL
jgi:hypothetical protein